MKFTRSFPLLIITLIAGVLRFIYLDKYPVSLNWDEVSHGYNAYSLLITGKDEWGNSFPLIFRAFGDYKLPLYIYLTVIPVWLLGLSSLSVRFISALSGTLAIPGIYLLTRELFPNHQIKFGKLSLSMASVSALILTFLPWHIFISRPALEANLSLTLTIFGFYFLHRFVRGTSSILPAVCFLGLSLHTYNTSRVFVPLLITVVVVMFRGSLFRSKSELKFSRLKFIIAICCGMFFAGIVVIQVFNGEGMARYEKLKILSPAAIFQIGESRSGSPLPPQLARLIYNRPVYLLSTIAKNYLGYFSPSFFSQNWGAQFQFSIPSQHLLTIPLSLLIVIGLFFSLKNLRTDGGEQLLFIIIWLLLAPLAASLTADPPQALRPNPMIPPLVIFAALGATYLSSVLINGGQRAALLILFTLLYLLSVGKYLDVYYFNYASAYSSSWQYGYREVVEYLTQHQSEYQNIFITKRYGEPHIFYAFFSKLSPEILQNDQQTIRFKKSEWYWTDRVKNIYFVNDWQIPKTDAKNLPLESGSMISTAHSLLVTSPDRVPVNGHILKIVNFLNNEPAFIIVSIP